MYVRQLKQYLRATDGAFDERKWGFTNIMDFLRVLQREGLLRLERDRRGQIRVFPGNAFQRTTVAAVQEPAESQSEPVEDVVEAEPVETQESVQVDAEFAEITAPEAIDIEASEPEPAKPRRSRKATGKPAAKKPVRRPPRGRKKPELTEHPA